MVVISNHKTNKNKKAKIQEYPNIELTVVKRRTRIVKKCRVQNGHTQNGSNFIAIIGQRSTGGNDTPRSSSSTAVNECVTTVGHLQDAVKGVVAAAVVTVDGCVGHATNKTTITLLEQLLLTATQKVFVGIVFLSLAASHEKSTAQNDKKDPISLSLTRRRLRAKSTLVLLLDHSCNFSNKIG